MKKYIKNLTLIIFIFLGLTLSFNFVLSKPSTGDGGDDDGGGGCSCKVHRYTYHVYSCAGSCPAKIEKRTYRGCSSSCCDTNDPCEGYPQLISGPTIVATGESWQACVSGPYTCEDCSNDPSPYKPYFVCSGTCLSNISDVRYYSNPNYPQNPELTNGSEEYPEQCSEEITDNCIEPDNGSSDVKLPLKIDWNEDPYWQKAGGCGYFGCPNDEVDPNGTKSYKLSLKVNGDIVSPPTSVDSETFSDYISKNFSQDEKEIKDGYFIKVLNLENQPNYIDKGTYRSSEYNFRVDHNPCWLKSGEKYELNIQTCCKSDGTECNSGESLYFTTSYAPELKSPEDLDWEGLNYSAWNPWSELIKDDYDIDVEGRILSLPNNKYNPFDWANNDPDNYSNSKIDFPIMLDWCDVDEVNGIEKLNKGAWEMKLFQVVLNEDEKEEEILHSGTSNGTIAIISSPVKAGVDWTDLLFSNYFDEVNNYFFTENEKYSWEIQSCLTDQGSCKGYGEHWSFETANSDLSPNFSFLHNNGDILGIPTEIRWSFNKKAKSVKYSIPGIVSGETNQGGIIVNDLELNKSYTITLIPCSDYESQKCEPENAKALTFETTGLPPEINDFNGEQSIPLTIGWKDIPGAKSYIYNLNGKEVITQNIYETLHYPEVKSDTFYSLKVKTCASEGGNNCGEYSVVKTFRTKKIEKIDNISTEDNGGILYTNNRNVSWEDAEGAFYYKYALAYVGDDNSKTCTELRNKGVVESIISENSFYVSSLCSGTYNVSLTACLDVNCNDHGDTNKFSFNLDSKKAPEGLENHTGGLIPCNREYDNPETAWDETLSCSVDHVFLIIRLIFDFFLSRFIPATIVVLLIYDGGLLLFHNLINFETPAADLIAKSKAIWIAVGIGFLIIFLSWTAINFFLLFFDTNMSFFNNWWN